MVKVLISTNLYDDAFGTDSIQPIRRQAQRKRNRRCFCFELKGCCDALNSFYDYDSANKRLAKSIAQCIYSNPREDQFSIGGLAKTFDVDHSKTSMTVGRDHTRQF